MGVGAGWGIAERKGGGGGLKRGVDWTWGGGVEGPHHVLGQCWLQCARKVICCVRSRLWQNSIFIITVAISFYRQKLKFYEPAHAI